MTCVGVCCCHGARLVISSQHRQPKPNTSLDVVNGSACVAAVQCEVCFFFRIASRKCQTKSSSYDKQQQQHNLAASRTINNYHFTAEPANNSGATNATSMSARACATNVLTCATVDAGERLVMCELTYKYKQPTKHTHHHPFAPLSYFVRYRSMRRAAVDAQTRSRRHVPRRSTLRACDWKSE